jgi:hypothetical protein
MAKKLKTLEQHEWLSRPYYERPLLNGIACPKCGHELLDSNPGVLLLSKPPQLNIHCSSCPYKGTRTA